jgi:cytochrome P450
LQPTVDGSHLSDSDLENFFTLMVAAGNDTTRYSMTAAMKALTERPAVREALTNDMSALPVAVEEMLRWGSVTMHFRRTATQDVTLRGKMIKKGDKVVIWFVSANYDEDQFPDPYHFDVSRTPNDHVTFGFQSPHLCIGAPLARLEMRVLYEEMLPHIKEVGFAGKQERLRSNFISGIKSLPLEISWR